MGTVSAPVCRGMERYQEMMGWDKPHYFSVSLIKLHGEEEIRRMRNHKLCIALFKEALKIEDSIGPQERKLLGHYARSICQPKKVVEMIRRLAERGYEKEHGQVDFSLQVDTEIEILFGRESGKGKEAILNSIGDLLKEAGETYVFKDWELRLILGYACQCDHKEELAGMIRESVLLQGIPEERAFYLAGKAEQARMQEAGAVRMEGMAGYIYARDDLGLGKAEMKEASFLLHHGELLRRCKDGTRFYRTDPFTVDGSYIIPHFYLPVFGDACRIDHFEVADEKRAEVLSEMYEGLGDMPGELVKEMKQGKSVLKEIRDYQKKMAANVGGAARKEKVADVVEEKAAGGKVSDKKTGRNRKKSQGAQR